MMPRYICVIVGLVMLSAAAGADPVELLTKLEGTWEVDLGTMGGGKPAVCVGQKIAGGKGIYTVFKREMEKDTYSAHAIWTYDPETKKVYVYEINSFGDVYEHVGNFGKDGVLRLVRYARKGKRAVVQKTVMEWKSADEIVSKLEEKVKGKWEKYTFVFKKSTGG